MHTDRACSAVQQAAAASSTQKQQQQLQQQQQPGPSRASTTKASMDIMSTPTLDAASILTLTSFPSPSIFRSGRADRAGALSAPMHSTSDAASSRAALGAGYRTITVIRTTVTIRSPALRLARYLCDALFGSVQLIWLKSVESTT